MILFRLGVRVYWTNSRHVIARRSDETHPEFFAITLDLLLLVLESNVLRSPVVKEAGGRNPVEYGRNTSRFAPDPPEKGGTRSSDSGRLDGHCRRAGVLPPGIPAFWCSGRLHLPIG